MAVQFRRYIAEPRFSRDYEKVRMFLLRAQSYTYTFGRWDWMITHGYLDATGLPKIGLWEEDGGIVGLATYDCGLGKAYLLYLPGYESLYEEMLLYAKQALSKDGQCLIWIPDGASSMQETAARLGLHPTQEKESDAVIPIVGSDFTYRLPDGFRITDMKAEFDLHKYGEVLWKGFNHEANGEGAFTWNAEKEMSYRAEFMRPNVNLSLKVAVAAPDGRFVSYCGMWFDPASPVALVEPVATDPEFRKMGLGRAAVLEAVKRCGLLGAKEAVVGSSQQFYYRIGFRPLATSTWWE